MPKSHNPVMLESDVQKAILDYCAAERIFCQRRNTGAMKATYKGKKRFIRFSKTGMSDLWGITKSGQHWECEVKRPGEEPTLEQQQWLEDCRRAGALAFWVDNLDSFIAWIQEQPEPYASVKTV